MDSDEKKPGGGAGGGDEDHADDRWVDGLFSREADNIYLMTHPVESGVIKIYATGDGSSVEVMGEDRAIVRTGVRDLPTDSLPGNLKKSGVLIYAPGEQEIHIYRGDPGPTSQFIELKPNAINIDAGIGGTLTLKAGSSSIEIAPTGITIKGPLVKIN